MRARAIAIFVLFFFFFPLICSAFDITPSNPQPGDKIAITGTATPGEQLGFRSSFSMSLPVSNGQYEYVTSVQIPQTPNRLAVTANNVKDLNLGVKMVIWITKRFEASGGTASISQANVPPGRYDLKMFGTALEGASKVAVDVNAETAIVADSIGKYSLVIDTSGIPSGNYRIEGGGDSKVIPLGIASSSSASSLSESSAGSAAYPSSLKGNSRGLAITPDIVTWYAAGHRLDSKNTTQYAEAERQIKAMTSDDYWKVIARGEPLTEKAGNCDDKYCLVRGKDACTTCRYEEMVASEMAAKSTVLPQKANITAPGDNSTGKSMKTTVGVKNTTILNATATKNNGPLRDKSFINSIIEWILSIIGGWVR